jgi:adenylate cyclase
VSVSPLGSSQGTIRFGDLNVDLHSGELRKRGMRIKLQVQPFQVLQMLLEHAGEVVTREELQKRIWPADTFVDFDQGLNNAVKRLREALGDDAEKPRFIETLSKRGYRFISPVEELVKEPRIPAMPASAVTVDSIVVLPFTNMSADPENEFFADGITEEIINALAQLPQLYVVARSSAFSFKGKHIDPRVVGEQLKVRTILEGSVRKAGDCLRITAQLVNAADGFHLWSERYDREMRDIFAIQDDIARSIAERLTLTLDRTERESLVRAGTKNLEAYQLYLKGRTLVYRRGGAIPHAVECFEKAVRLDPDYALAWAGLADAYSALGYYGLAPTQACMPKGTEAARRAVALGPSLAEAHAALAMAALMGTWDEAEAEREFLRALDLNPRHIQARGSYALYYLTFAKGCYKEAMAQAKLALECDPLSSYAHSAYGMICGCAGQCAEAVQATRRGMELDPASYIAHHTLHLALHVCGRFEESVAIGEQALAMSGRHSWTMGTLAVTFADWGKPADADALYAEMLARARRQYVPPAILALAAAATSKEDEAICHARNALESRDPMCPLFSKHWSQTARLYAYPRFREIIARMGRIDWLQD